MEVNLAIDQGNTSTKAALFHCGTLIEARRIEEPVAKPLRGWPWDTACKGPFTAP